MPPVGFKPTISAGEVPQTARPLGPANSYLLSVKINIIRWFLHGLEDQCWM